jgi:type I restriction enzyme S subunit
LLIKEKKIKKEKPLTEITEKEIPNALPKNWSWSKLGNSGYTQTGSTPPKKHPEYYGDFIPFIGPADISNQGMKYPVDGLSEKGISVGRLIPKGSIMMVCIGGSIGKCYINEMDVSCNQQINTITPILIPSVYIKTICQSPFFQNQVWEKSSGSATPIINKGKWENIIVPLPPLEEQNAIVATVNQLFAEVEQLEDLTKQRISLKEDFVTSALRQLSTEDTNNAWAFLQPHFKSFFTEKSSVKKLRESILQLAVQGKLTTHWRSENSNIEDASVLLERIKAEKEALIEANKIKKEKMLPEITEKEVPYELPEGWVWCRMQDVCPNISSGSTPPKPFFTDEGVPYLKVYNIRNQKIDFGYREQFVDEEYHDTKLKRSILKPGDVIMNIVGPPLGKIAIIPDDFPEWNCNQAISFFKPLHRKLNTWLYTFLLAGTFLDHIELIGTAGQDNISVTKSKTIPLPLPPLEEQKAIVEKVNALMALCDTLEKEIETHQTTQEHWMQSCLKEVFEKPTDYV